MKPIIYLNPSIHLGSDPEAFFVRDGKVIGSEKVIPLKWDQKTLNQLGSAIDLITRDGVQVEFHPMPSGSPSSAVSQLQSVLLATFGYLDKLGDVKLSFQELVSVEREELDSLAPENRILGCQPSKNMYQLKKATVDGAKYRKRSAGGHIHVGLLSTSLMGTGDYRPRLPFLFDILLGTVGVLLDRDMDQVERRKVYGQAGEYRLQKYGLEYRTLSNFWLRSPVLAELMYGLAAITTDVLIKTVNKEADYEMGLVGKLNYKQVIKSIQLNDLELGLANWKHVREFIQNYIHIDSTLNATNLQSFEKMVGVVNKDGLDKYFPSDYESVRQAWTKPVSLKTFLGGI